MNKLRDYKSPREIYDHLYQVLSSDEFLNMEGLGNEIPFFIQPYNPSDHEEITRIIEQLESRLMNEGIKILNINLYDLSIELLKERGIWEEVLDIETAITKGELKELLQGVLDPETHLVPAIAQKMEQETFDILFLTGVGAVYPFIRSHNILNNLQSTAKDRPLVMFFPGKYTHSLEKGASLDLFDKLHDDKYYRAFNLDHVQP